MKVFGFNSMSLSIKFSSMMAATTRWICLALIVL